MGYDLIGGRGARFHWEDWPKLLRIAEEFGWQPEGTKHPGHLTEWNGSYLSNDYQEVTQTDAIAMAAALFRASSAVRSGKLTAKQSELLDIDLREIQELAAYADGGRFLIS